MLAGAAPFHDFSGRCDREASRACSTGFDVLLHQSGTCVLCKLILRNYRKKYDVDAENKIQVDESPKIRSSTPQ